MTRQIPASTAPAVTGSSLTGSNASDLQSSFDPAGGTTEKSGPDQSDAEQLTTQLAQISTLVSGIEKSNTTLGSVSGQIDNSQFRRPPT